MPNQKSSNWGGRREGAGRKPKGKSKSKSLNITISFRLHSKSVSQLEDLLIEGESVNTLARDIVLDALENQPATLVLQRMAEKTINLAEKSFGKSK